MDSHEAAEGVGGCTVLSVSRNLAVDGAHINVGCPAGCRWKCMQLGQKLWFFLWCGSQKYTCRFQGFLKFIS